MEYGKNRKKKKAEKSKQSCGIKEEGKRKEKK